MTSLLDHQRQASVASAELSRSFADELERRRLLREGWAPECLDSERRFGSREARLYPLVRHEINGVVTNESAVVTPHGPATLLQVFADRPGRPGAMVMPLRPKAFFWVDGRKKAAAVFVAVADVEPYRKESS